MHLTLPTPARKTAPSVGVGRAENRVWGFFGDGVKRTWKIDPQVVEQHLEKTTTESRTELGVPHWPSRDPIGERGGLNLYAMVRNNAVNWIDRLGLLDFSPDVGTNASASDFGETIATANLLEALERALVEAQLAARRKKATEAAKKLHKGCISCCYHYVIIRANFSREHAEDQNSLNSTVNNVAATGVGVTAGIIASASPAAPAAGGIGTGAGLLASEAFSSMTPVIMTGDVMVTTMKYCGDGVYGGSNRKGREHYKDSDRALWPENIRAIAENLGEDQTISTFDAEEAIRCTSGDRVWEDFFGPPQSIIDYDDGRD
jgi:hypothetical protein